MLNDYKAALLFVIERKLFQHNLPLTTSTIIYAFEEKFYENYTGNANKTDEDEIEELSTENFE